MEINTRELDKVLPFNIEAEKSVLGAIMIDPVKMASIQTIINEEDFYKHAHQVIFKSMVYVFDKSGMIDIVTLSNQLDAYDELNNIGGLDYLVEISQYTPTTSHIEEYAQIVKEKSTLRRLIDAANKISHDAYNEVADLSTIIDTSEKLILSIGENSQSNRMQEMRHLVYEAYEKVVELAEEKRDVTGLSTGYRDLDKLTSGFQPDQLIILAARPSVGKTAFALNIAQNVATKSKVPVAIFSLEMGALDLVFRMICAEGNIHASNMRTGQLTEDEWSSFTIATDTLKDAEIYIDDSAGIKVSEIRAKCRRLKQENPELGLVVIDYLQLIEGSGKENRQQEVSDISRQLKKLAKELKIPVIALSQLSRGLENRQNKRPILSDIRESGSIEQDADIVAFLYRHDYHRHDEEGEQEELPGDLPDNTVEVILAKNRAGARDTVNLLFKKEYNKFSSLSYQSEPGL